MHRSPLHGSLRRRSGTARRGLSRSHRNQHSRDAASNRASHPCCAPDVLAHGDTSPPDPCDASGRGNSSLHGSANRHANSGAHARAEPNAAPTGSYPNRHAIAHSNSGAHARAKPHAASHGATGFYPNCHAIAHSNSGAHGNATTHAYPHRDSGAHGDADPDANPCAHPLTRP